jgi:hypothetical protein
VANHARGWSSGTKHGLIALFALDSVLPMADSLLWREPRERSRGDFNTVEVGNQGLQPRRSAHASRQPSSTFQD